MDIALERSYPTPFARSPLLPLLLLSLARQKNAPSASTNFNKEYDFIVGLKLCQRVGTSDSLKKLGAEPFQSLYTGCEKYADDDDQYFECQVRSVVVSIYHPVGTAKMGDPKDPTTVVDPELKVLGMKGLRVVDASIMPVITSGNTNIPVIIIAEKASDFIKADIL